MADLYKFTDLSKSAKEKAIKFFITQYTGKIQEMLCDDFIFDKNGKILMSKLTLNKEPNHWYIHSYSEKEQDGYHGVSRYGEE